MPPTPPPLPPTPTDGFRLSPAQLQAVTDAQRRAAKIRRAISVAKFDAWTTGVFGALTLLFGLLSFSWVGLLLGIGMGIVTFVEFRGAQRLRQLDPDAAKTLGLNQLFFGGLLIAYALYSLWGVYHDQSALLNEIKGAPEMKNLMMDAQSLAQMIGLLVYGTLIAVGLFGQGGTALYYFSRRKYIDGYLRDTPAWIVDAQRAGLPM
jgi:hypothetical protein